MDATGEQTAVAAPDCSPKDLQREVGLSSTDATARVAGHRRARTLKSHGKRLNTTQRNALEIRALQREFQVKRAQVDKLERENIKLQAEHQLLVACCDGMQLLRIQQGQASEVEQEEVELLAQLQNIEYSLPHNCCACTSSSAACNFGCKQSTAAWACTAVCPTTAATAMQDLLHQQLSPPDDRMYYFRRMVALPPLQGVEDFTLEGLAADYSHTIHSLALQLHLAQGSVPMPCCEAETEAGLMTPGQKITEILDRHFGIVARLILQQRSKLIDQFMLTNFVTMETTDEPSLDRHIRTVGVAGITAEQREIIAQGVELFRRLLSPIISERLQLQQQVSSAEPQAYGCAGYKQQLEQLQKQLQRLSVLLRKESLAKVAASAWILGGLTYAQVATLAIHCTPYPGSVSLVGKILHMQYQQQTGNSG